MTPPDPRGRAIAVVRDWLETRGVPVEAAPAALALVEHMEREGIAVIPVETDHRRRDLVSMDCYTRALTEVQLLRGRVAQLETELRGVAGAEVEGVPV